MNKNGLIEHYKSLLNCEIGDFNVRVLDDTEGRNNTYTLEVMPSSVTESVSILEGIRDHKYKGKEGVLFFDIFLYVGFPSNSAHIVCNRMFSGHKSKKRNVEFSDENEFNKKVKKQILSLAEKIYREAVEAYDAGNLGVRQSGLISEFGAKFGGKVSSSFHKSCAEVTFKNGINVFKDESGSITLTGLNFTDESISELMRSLSSMSNKG